jgi:hypothetical protein
MTITTKSHVIYRNSQLANPVKIKIPQAVDEAFKDLELMEEESVTYGIEAPVLNSDRFWNEDLEEEWDDLADAMKEAALLPPPPAAFESIIIEPNNIAIIEDPIVFMGENVLSSHNIPTKLFSPAVTVTPGVVNNRVNQFEGLRNTNSKSMSMSKYKDSSANSKSEYDEMQNKYIILVKIIKVSSKIALKFIINCINTTNNFSSI